MGGNQMMVEQCKQDMQKQQVILLDLATKR